MVGTAKDVFDRADLVVKVKEPQLSECAMLRPDQVLFTYLHLAASREVTEALLESGTTAVAYETVEWEGIHQLDKLDDSHALGLPRPSMT